ncbi:MAG: DUF1192 family protein [Alphaproteobacteria bacterium]
MARPDDEEEIAKVKRPREFPRALDDLSIAAMEEYRAELAAEDVRVRAEIDKRGGAKAKAEAFFK